MSSEPRPKLARRVLTGVNAEGRSVIVGDADDSPRALREQHALAGERSRQPIGDATDEKSLRWRGWRA